jgi:6-phosphogluconolactonase
VKPSGSHRVIELRMIESFKDEAELADAAAAAAAGRLAEGLRRDGRATLVATGGRSPGPAYDRLAAANLDWSRIDVTLSDERFVPPTSPDSNEALVRARLLTGPAGAAAFVPLWSDAASPDAAAALAEPAIGALTPFDVVLLGMGEDGHVASLIPGSPTLAAGMDPEGGRLCLGVPAGVGSPPLPRITLTLAALLQARSILILISGATKRQVIQQAAAGADLPVRALLVQDRVPVRVFWSP